MSLPDSRQSPAPRDQEAAPAAGYGPTGTTPTPVVSGAPAAERRRVRVLTGVAVLAVLLVAVALVFGVAWNSARSAGPTANQAFVDSGDTAELVGQVTAAIVTIYSYDYRTLPANEASAKALITGRLAQEFDGQFARIKQDAPAQRQVLHTTVPAAAVAELAGNRATVLMFVDQAGTKGPVREPTASAARLVVDAEWVDGRWKIAEVTPE